MSNTCPGMRIRLEVFGCEDGKLTYPDLKKSIGQAIRISGLANIPVVFFHEDRDIAVSRTDSVADVIYRHFSCKEDK